MLTSAVRLKNARSIRSKSRRRAAAARPARKASTKTSRKGTARRPSNAVANAERLAEIERLKTELTAARARIAELEAHADIDPLLEILNRRGFERELARSIAYVKRYGADAVLLYIDLDGFKTINDAHGHNAGDELLRTVTAALVSQVRASDVIGRLGGDEFALVLWNMSVEHAGGKARALEDVIARATITRGEAKLSVGASAGIAALSPLDTAAQAIDAADRAMYMRKREKQAGA
jgi:diguanylate cyclase (GGDEF)-like protein